VEALKAIGLPTPDYVLDMGEFAYSYHGKQCGYRMFVDQASVVEHNIGGEPGLSFARYRIGVLEFKLRELSPIRCYYMTRNCLYFGLYVYKDQFLLSAAIVAALRMIKLTGSYLLRFRSRSPQLAACLRGIRDGLSKQMHRRYRDEDSRAHSYLQQ
jgi:GT2 family glycosyltransferase